MASNDISKDTTLELIQKLIRLEYDAIGAYQAAIDRVELEGNPLALQGFAADHERHLQELSNALRELGQAPPQQGDFKGVLAKGAVLATSRLGDRAVLTAMKRNEEHTNRAYDEVLSRADLDPKLREVVERNLWDEQRHWAWFDERIVQLAGEVTE
jgi:uncharacterized protein (TIGR02284 family)